MSVPVEYDFAQIKVNGTVICDITSVSVNEGAETSTRYRRDCATPGKPATRRSRVVGRFWDITGTGLSDDAQNPTVRALIGIREDYEVLMYQDDGSDAGVLLGTYSGEAIMTTRNISTDREGESGQEVAFEGQGNLTFTPA